MPLFLCPIMSWLFCYFVEARYGYIYREPSPWFNVNIVTDNCPDTIFHCSETHKIHKYGGYLKHFGLRTCMILEAKTEEDAVMLRMLEDQLVIPNTTMKARAPVLQLILNNPDYQALDALCEPIDAYKKDEYKRKGDIKATNVLQRQIDRVMMTVEDLRLAIGEDYIKQAGEFVDNSYAEIERIRKVNKSEAAKVAVARRSLRKKLLSYATFSLNPKLM